MIVVNCQYWMLGLNTGSTRRPVSLTATDTVDHRSTIERKVATRKEGHNRIMVTSCQLS